MSDRPPDFFMRCVFEVVEVVEDARGTQNLKEYPEARKGLYDQISHGLMVMQVCVWFLCII